MSTNRKIILLPLLATVTLFAAACGSDESASTEPESVDSTLAPADTSATTEAAEGDAGEPPLTPATLSADAQESDGSTVTVASIDLPAPGFIAIHGDADGSPGAVIGNSDLLPAGESTDVTVTLDEPLAESGTVFPMAHVDVNDNGEYEFNGSDVTVDQPASTEAGDVAVLPVELTVG